MADREKTIARISELLEGMEEAEGWEPVLMPLFVARDALELLKQDAREEDDGK